VKWDENLNIGADEGRTHFGLESVWGMLGGRRVAENRPVTPLLGGNYPLLKVRIVAGTTFNEQTTPQSIHVKPRSIHKQRKTIHKLKKTTQNNAIT
jgi:hypothetical protein